MRNDFRKAIMTNLGFVENISLAGDLIEQVNF
jgi:hypothetical protein